MELNYKDWKDMLVSKTAVSSEDASVRVTEASSDETAEVLEYLCIKAPHRPLVIPE